MCSLTLRHLLPGVCTPTLLVWEGEDAITPIECSEIYQRAMRLVVIENWGHMPEMVNGVGSRPLYARPLKSNGQTFSIRGATRSERASFEDRCRYQLHLAPPTWRLVARLPAAAAYRHA